MKNDAAWRKNVIKNLLFGSLFCNFVVFYARICDARRARVRVREM